MAKLKVKAKEDVVGKWAEVTPARASYYEKYATVAGAEWEAKASAAAATYKSAVTAPDIDKRFQMGVKNAGAAKFERKVKEVGVGRFGPGVTAAKPDYDAKFAPYLAEIAAIEVPDRKPRGDPANLDRVKAIATALNKKRLAMLAAGR